MHDDQAEELLKGIEVAIAVQERVTFPNAVGRDDPVDGLANRAPFRTQQTIVPGGRGRELETTC